jgi:hypothetical protein
MRRACKTVEGGRRQHNINKWMAGSSNWTGQCGKKTKQQKTGKRNEKIRRGGGGNKRNIVGGGPEKRRGKENPKKKKKN